MSVPCSTGGPSRETTNEKCNMLWEPMQKAQSEICSESCSELTEEIWLLHKAKDNLAE